MERRVVTDWKPAPRIVNPDLLAMLRLEHDACEVTGRGGAFHLHHCIYRSQQGDDVRGNLLALHTDLHDRYHRSDPNALFLIGTHVRDHRPDILHYITGKMGGGYADMWLAQHLTREAA
jgi:hypothetical protein